MIRGIPPIITHTTRLLISRPLSLTTAASDLPLREADFLPLYKAFFAEIEKKDLRSWLPAESAPPDQCSPWSLCTYSERASILIEALITEVARARMYHPRASCSGRG